MHGTLTHDGSYGSITVLADFNQPQNKTLSLIHLSYGVLKMLQLRKDG